MMSFRMLKEQEPFGEHDTHSTSKNAKDKSNSATLWASQGGTHRVQSGMGDKSTCMLYCDSEKDSEKDSGYSEAGSDSVHTDVDDQRSSVNKPQRESRKCSNNNNANPAGPDMTSYENIPPICLVVKPVQGRRPDWWIFEMEEVTWMSDEMYLLPKKLCPDEQNQLSGISLSG